MQQRVFGLARERAADRHARAVEIARVEPREADLAGESGRLRRELCGALELAYRERRLAAAYQDLPEQPMRVSAIGLSLDGVARRLLRWIEPPRGEHLSRARERGVRALRGLGERRRGREHHRERERDQARSAARAEPREKNVASGEALHRGTS